MRKDESRSITVGERADVFAAVMYKTNLCTGKFRVVRKETWSKSSTDINGKIHTRW